jgi:hypothetical protein
MRDLLYVAVRLGCMAMVAVELLWTGYAFWWLQFASTESGEGEATFFMFWFVSQGVLFPLAALSAYVFFTQEY